MKKYLLILILIVGNLSAAYMKVTLKNNTYDIYSSCSTHIDFTSPLRFDSVKPP